MIDRARIPQPFPILEIPLPPLTLRVRAVRSSAIESLIPIQAQPLQILEHRADKRRPTALRIQIFIAQHECALRLARTPVRDRKRTCVSDVKQTRRRGREPPAVG